MVSKSVLFAASASLALCCAGAAQAAMLTDPLALPDASAAMRLDVEPQDLSAGWLEQPGSTSGGSRLVGASSWSWSASVPGPSQRPAASFEVGAHFGLMLPARDLSGAELVQANTPVPLPPALWAFCSGLLLLVVTWRGKAFMAAGRHS